eukprot:g2927.t1
MRAGGLRTDRGGGGLAPAGGSGSSIDSDWITVEAEAAAFAAAGVKNPDEDDVPNTVDYNGETLTFGDYRRPTILERCVLTLAAIGPVGWKAFHVFRKMQRTWSKVLVALIAPALAGIVRSFIAFFYREIVLQPKLRPPENVAFPNSRFEDVDGLLVHYLREDPDPSADGGEGVAPPECVLHMNHGFGASSSSWSPVIRRLSRELGALAVAHDTPGFGLTARAGLPEANRYSLRSNAAITRELLRRAIGELGASTANPRRCVLMGHSMGCITAATAALDPLLPPQHTTLVLVAPALSLGSNSKKLTAEQRRAAARRKAAATAAVTAGGVLGVDGGAEAAAPQASSENGFLRGGGRRGAGSSASSRRGFGASGVVGAVVGAPVSAANAVLHVGVWLFNWCFLPIFYPLEILGLRALVYRGNFWRAALRKAWVDTAGVNLDVVNRYRWPTLVRYWDRGFALFLLDRLQIGEGGRVGPSGLVEAVAVKAAEGMKVVVVQGDEDVLVSLDKAKAIADAIPDAKLVVLPACGHVPHEERTDDFLRLVLEQLGGEGCSPPQDGSAGSGQEETLAAPRK